MQYSLNYQSISRFGDVRFAHFRCPFVFSQGDHTKRFIPAQLSNVPSNRQITGPVICWKPSPSSIQQEADSTNSPPAKVRSHAVVSSLLMKKPTMTSPNHPTSQERPRSLKNNRGVNHRRVSWVCSWPRLDVDDVAVLIAVNYFVLAVDRAPLLRLVHDIRPYAGTYRTSTQGRCNKSSLSYCP